MTTLRSAPALLGCLLAGLLAAAPSPARAEAWAAISGGASLPSGSSPYGSYEARPTASLAVGWDSTHVGASVWAAVVTTGAGVLLEETAFPVILRVRGRLPLGLAVPFVFGGVGFAPTRALLDMVSFTSVAFAAQAGAGVDLEFGDMFTLGAEAGYLWLAPSYAFGTVKMNGTLVLATLGLRFP